MLTSGAEISVPDFVFFDRDAFVKPLVSDYFSLVAAGISMVLFLPVPPSCLSASRNGMALFVELWQRCWCLPVLFAMRSFFS